MQISEEQLSLILSGNPQVRNQIVKAVGRESKRLTVGELARLCIYTGAVEVIHDHLCISYNKLKEGIFL